MRTLLFLIAIVFASVMAEEDFGNPFLELYQEYDSTGNKFVIDESTTTLPSFDNMASSYCVHGLFIMYEAPNYNHAVTRGGLVWAWSVDSQCFNMEDGFNNRASSVRYVGDKEDIRVSTISFFQREGFGGSVGQYNKDSPSIEYRRSSAIVTGNEPWTLYDATSYEGDSTCIYPGENFNPGFYPTKVDFGSFAGRVKSIKRGCHSENKLYPSAMAEEGKGSFTGSFNV